MQSDKAEAIAAAEEVVRINCQRAAGDSDRIEELIGSLRALERALRAALPIVQATLAYRRAYSSLVPAELVRQLHEAPLADFDLTISTYNTLRRLGCDTLVDVSQSTRRDIIYASRAPRWCLEEIDLRLELVGLGPMESGAPPDFPEAPVQLETTFGALNLRPRPRDTVADIRTAIIDAYAANGVFPVAPRHEQILDAQLNTDGSLGPDIVLIDESYDPWITIMSCNWELTPLGKHPLALRLSSRWPIISVTAIEDVSYELCRYDHGEPQEYAAIGRPAGRTELDTPLRPLDFGDLTTDSAVDASPPEIRAAFGNPRLFGILTGLSAGGFRTACEGMLLQDYPADTILYFDKQEDGRPKS
ncbi:hypothetical protein [Nocardia sp. BMG51109]|uniref:hypothetical protein n=1 Tax=Nocardia sp. BMG51109 TaxID=1056816 RepID=UPI000463BD98|nr:hypothetical protein [Nocardia sp. BMG51109]